MSENNDKLSHDNGSISHVSLEKAVLSRSEMEGLQQLLEALLPSESSQFRTLIRVEFELMDGNYTQKVEELSKKHCRSESRIKAILTETKKEVMNRTLTKIHNELPNIHNALTRIGEIKNGD